MKTSSPYVSDDDVELPPKVARQYQKDRMADDIMHIEKAQHWIARVRDSINGYDEVQAAYFDGTQVEAERYFRNIGRCWAVARYMTTEANRARYQVIMAANAIVLQDGES